MKYRKQRNHADTEGYGLGGNGERVPMGTGLVFGVMMFSEARGPVPQRMGCPPPTALSGVGVGAFLARQAPGGATVLGGPWQAGALPPSPVSPVSPPSAPKDTSL